MIAQTYKAVVNHDPYKPYVPTGGHQKQTQLTLPTPGSATRPNEVDKNRANQFGITPEEFVRRDMIVRQLFLDTAMFYKPGDVVECRSQKNRNDYGRINIRGVFKSYHDFPTAEAVAWPKDDIPYIFTVQPEKTEMGDIVLCTADFFQVAKGTT